MPREVVENGLPAAALAEGVVVPELRIGVDADATQAFDYFRKAAESGVALAVAQMASAYADGSGVARDVGEARRLYRKAIELGVDGAEEALAALAEADVAAAD